MPTKATVLFEIDTDRMQDALDGFAQIADTLALAARSFGMSMQQVGAAIGRLSDHQQAQVFELRILQLEIPYDPNIDQS